MYEKFGLTSLERLIGLEVSEVCFVLDYIQIMFKDIAFTCWTLPKIHVADRLVAPSDPGYKNLLCGLIGEVVQSVSEKLGSELYIAFENQTSITISLRLEDEEGPEAAMLMQEGGGIFDVWRYGDE